MQRLAVFAASASLLVGLVGCSSASVPRAASTAAKGDVAESSSESSYDFSVLSRSFSEETAVIHAPLYREGGVIRIVLVSSVGLEGTERCEVTILDGAPEISGACELVLPLKRTADGALDGVQVRLVNVESSEREVDVFVHAMQRDPDTGEFKFNADPPAVGRLTLDERQ